MFRRKSSQSRTSRCWIRNSNKVRYLTNFAEHANISQGIFIQTSQPYTVGTLLHFQFTSIDQGELIDGLGRVVHVKEDEFGNHGVGLEFLNLSDDSEEVIEKIVTSRYDSE